MAHGESAANLESGFSEGLGKRAEVEDPEFDVTAMVDLVSLMNIYFIVAWVVAMQSEVDLPAARKVVTGDPDASVMVIIKQADPGGLQVIIGEDATVEPLTDRAEILKKVEEAVKAGAKVQKNTLLLKAEKHVALKDIVHVASGAAAVDGTQLRLAVMEKDK